MTTVAAANAELTAVNRARQAVADPAPTEDSSSDGSQAFAAVLTTTRQTTMMLRRLLDQRVDQISSSHQRRQQAAEAVTPGGNRRTVSETDPLTPTRAEKRPSRSDSTSDRGEAGRRSSSSDDDSSARADGPAETARFSRDEGYQAVAPENREPAAVTTSEREGAEISAAGSRYAEGSPSQTDGARSAVQQAAHVTQSPAEAASASSASGSDTAIAGSASPAQTSVVGRPETASVVTQQMTAVAASPVITPADAGSQANSGNGSASELGQSGASAKAGQAASRTAAAPAEFQSLLQQAGRTRSALTAGATASAKSDLGGEEAVLDPSRAESIEKLARVLRSQLGSRNSTMTLRLDPPELGSLRVEVRMQDQNLTLRFQADTQAGHNALQGKLDALRQTLEQQGVRVEQMNVELRPQATDSKPQSQDWSNPSYYGGSQNGSGGAFGQTQEQGRGMQESYASAGFARWSDAPSSDGIGQQEIPIVGVGGVSASGVDLIA